MFVAFTFVGAIVCAATPATTCALLDTEPSGKNVLTCALLDTTPASCPWIIELIAYELVALFSELIEMSCKSFLVAIDELNDENPVVDVILTCSELDTVSAGNNIYLCTA